MRLLFVVRLSRAPYILAMSPESPLSWIELSRRALRRNVSALRRLAGERKLAVCVKANAYGHGLPEVVRDLTVTGEADYLTVHSIEEGLACRESGWTGPVMILGPIGSDQVNEIVENDFEPVVFDLATLRALGKAGDRRKVGVRTHLKLETGTHRQGITSAEMDKFAAVYKRHGSLQRPYGAAMHFANIEDTTIHEYANRQLAAFKELTSQMKKQGIAPEIRHTASSAALILFDKTRFELVRPGLATYGHWPSKETYLSYRLAGGENNLFHPVLSWKTRITQLKKVPADAFIGYGCTYRTTAPAKIAVLPVGYSEGFDRALSNRAHVLVRGRRAPVRGRVCMNLTMVDVTDIKGVRLGDEVVLIGRQGEESVTMELLASWAGTINYEIMARLSPRLPRFLTD